MTAAGDVDRDGLERLLLAYQWSHIVSAAVRLGIVEAVAEGPCTSDDVAARLGLDVEAVGRLLRALAGVGLVVHHGEQRFEPAPALFLLSAPETGSLGDLARLGELVGKAFGELSWTVSTGRSAFERAFDEQLFRYLRANADAAAAFNGGMVAMSHECIAAFATGYDLGGQVHVVDVGGGAGHLGAAIASARADAAVDVFDLPYVEADFVRYVEPLGLAGRCRFIAGNFFKSVPPGADAYILKSVIHDWNDTDAGRILRNCRDAMQPDGRVVVIERIVPERAGPDAATVLLFDVVMLAMAGSGAARERTLGEYDELARAAGLRRDDIQPLSRDFVAITLTGA